jgi:hypothetical protein
MTKSDEITLRHQFEANCRHSGLDTRLTFLGNYADPGVQELWVEVKTRGNV